MNQAFGGTPQYYRDAGYGAITQWQWKGRENGAGPLAADADYYLTTVTPTVVGSWVDASASLLKDGKPDVWRNATLTKTDANNSLMIVVEILGVNQFGSEEREILRLLAADSTVAGRVAWSEISSVKYKLTGVISSDTFTLGIGDVIGLPRQITDSADVITAISDLDGGSEADALASGNGTLFDVELSTIEFADDDPDGTSNYYVELRPTAPVGGTPPMRPRGAAVTVSSS